MRNVDMVENLQIEILSGDPASRPHGRFWKNSTENRAKLADLTNEGRHLLLNDEHLIIGTDETPSNNVRVNRASDGLLQFIPASNATAEGNLSSGLAQLAFKTENVVFSDLPAQGNSGRLMFSTDTKTPLIDDGDSIRPLHDLSTQAASETNKIVLSYDTRQNLELIPRKKASAYYSEDEKLLLIDDGVDLINPATGTSSGEALFTVESSLDGVDVTNHVMDATEFSMEEALGFNVNYALKRRTLINGYADTFYNSKLSDQAQYTDYQTQGAVRGFASNSTHLFMYGSFTDSGAANTRYFRGMLLNGSPDQTFNNNASAAGKFSASVYGVAAQDDDKILVVGQFEDYDGVNSYHKLIRLNADGTLDNVFTANASDNAKFPASGVLYDVKVQPDGKIIVAGSFVNYGGTLNRNGLIRLNSDGTEDATFNANIDGMIGGNSIMSVALQDDGKIVIGGTFSNYDGSGIDKVVRLNSDGTLDNTLQVDEDIANIKKVLVDPDGNVYVAGVGLYKFDPSGNGFAEFNVSNPNDNATLDDAIFDDQGRIITVGTFTYWEKFATITTGLRGCVRLETNGNVDLEFTKNSFTGTDFDVMTGVYGAFMFPESNEFIFGGYFTRQVGIDGINHVQAVKQDNYVFARQHQSGMATGIVVEFDDGTISIYTDQGVRRGFNNGATMAPNSNTETDLSAVKVAESNTVKLRADVNSISKPSGIEYRVSGVMKTKTLVIK